MVGEGGEMNEGEGRRVFGRGECIWFWICYNGEWEEWEDAGERRVWRGGGRNVQVQQ